MEKMEKCLGQNRTEVVGGGCKVHLDRVMKVDQLKR